MNWMSFARYLPALAMGLLPSICVTASFEDHGTGANKKIVERFDSLLASPALKCGIQGIFVQSAKTGEVWYERNSHIKLMPASCQKLLTSAAALDLLGPDFTYETLLLKSGTLEDDGTWQGNLYLKGSGDPLLNAADLDGFVDYVKAAGIKRIHGKLVGDDSRFDRERLGFGWEWDDLSYYYCAEVSGLNLNENVVTIATDAGHKPGDLVRVTLTPTDRYSKVTVRARTVEKGQPTKLNFERVIGRNEIFLDGTLALDAKPESHKPEKITVTNPTAYAAYYLVSRLQLAGISVTGGEAEGVTPEQNTTELARHTSLPLADILKKLNKPSDNLVAECLLRTLGAVKSANHVGSWSNGLKIAREWHKAHGMDAAELEMHDGSGLSRHNYVSPRNYAIMLKTMMEHKNSKEFVDSLPIAGVDGNLAGRMRETPAAGNCKAKTGSIGNVSTLGGYVTTKNGEPLIFVIMMNNQAESGPAQAAQDAIVTYLASFDK